jgi:uncharacterized protein YoxC
LSHEPYIKSREPIMGKTSIILIAVAVVVLVVALIMKKKA